MKVASTLLIAAAVLYGCGSGSSSESDAVTADEKGTNVYEIPNDPKCANIKLATYGWLGYPDRVNYAQSDLDRLLGVVTNETWYYLTIGYTRVYDWRHDVCTVTDFTQSHPRY
jgi:hypothetical protein